MITQPTYSNTFFPGSAAAAARMAATKTGATGSGTGTSSSSSTGDKTGQAEFLTLLTAQLQYQNPLDPMDNTQFVAQLATFSSLDQLIAIRDILEAQQTSATTTTDTTTGKA